MSPEFLKNQTPLEVDTDNQTGGQATHTLKGNATSQVNQKQAHNDGFPCLQYNFSVESRISGGVRFVIHWFMRPVKNALPPV
jgi:hypothetical protein